MRSNEAAVKKEDESFEDEKKEIAKVDGGEGSEEEA